MDKKIIFFMAFLCSFFSCSESFVEEASLDNNKEQNINKIMNKGLEPILVSNKYNNSLFAFNSDDCSMQTKSLHQQEEI